MSKSIPKTRSTTPAKQDPPIASAVGLLAACAVTLIGVAGDLSPEVILLRAIIAGSVSFALAGVMMTYWKAVSPKHEEE
ncbi:MAG TPA: hypothetical protein VNQ76_11560 [Planctomicrobium sp.]|nr:hypothetical protein [Planctomicrobium sp.]